MVDYWFFRPLVFDGFSWPDKMQVNNLLNVIMRRQSDTIGMIYPVM